VSLSEVDVAREAANEDPARAPAGARHAPGRLVRVGLAGYGRIGTAVARATLSEAGRLRDAGLEVRCQWALVRDLRRTRDAPPVPCRSSSASLSDVDVLVEALGGLEPARTIVAGMLERGIPVVSANKTLVARHGVELTALARRHQTTFAFDAAVLAGVPFIGSLCRRPIASAAREITGVLNGTSHVIVDALERGIPFEAALADACARGYAEPDSSADISGRDAAEKLAILLWIAGCAGVTPELVTSFGIDRLEPGDLAGARRLGGGLKPLAHASIDPANPGAWVGPAFVPARHPFANLRGVDNALTIRGAHGRAITFAGPGAGPEATAATILDDIVETLSLDGARWRPNTGVDGAVRAESLAVPPAGRWFLAVTAPGTRADELAEFLASRGVPAMHVVRQPDRWCVLTALAEWDAVSAVAEALRATSVRVIVLPIIEESDGE